LLGLFYSDFEIHEQRIHRWARGAYVRPVQDLLLQIGSR
jgi:hypothetical protein